MSKQLYTVSKEGLEYLCGLIRELSKVSEGIDDLNLRSDGTFSSLKINTLLDVLKQDCNEYTDKLVANLSRLELKIVTDEANMTESNIMYLYKPDGATSCNQYVVIEGNKVLLGTCDINMSDYYTITEADGKYTLKTTTDTLTTEVTNIKSDLNTHKDDTDIHITADERTKWNDATNEEKIKDIIDSEMTTKGVCTTKVADIPRTIITSIDADITLNINCVYTVINGICYVTLWGFESATTGQCVISTSMPKAKATVQTMCSYGTEGNIGGCIFVNEGDTDGRLYAEINKTGQPLYGGFSYPVAES